MIYKKKLNLIFRLMQGNLFSTMGRFVILKHLDITSFDATEKDAFFIDDAMKIDYVPIVGTNNSSNDELTNNNGETGNCMYLKKTQT